MSELQVEELLQSGFTRDEAMEALNMSNDENKVLPNLLDCMEQIKADMLKLNQFSQQYKETIESNLKSIHEESALYQNLIQQKEKELTAKIENHRNMLESKLIGKKQKYIGLTSKLQTIKESLDNAENNGNEKDMNNLSNIKHEIDNITGHNMQLLQSFHINKLGVNNHWLRIKDNIIATDIIAIDDEKKQSLNSDQNILSIDLMTFNVRNSLLDHQLSRSWTKHRRVLNANMLNKYGPPTIIATQEGVINQLIDIQCDLPTNYINIGAGRLPQKWYNSSNDRMNEHCKIYWNNDILAIIDYGTFELQRPKNAPLPRVATWCLYDFDESYHIKYGLLVVNTHLSYKSEEIRIVQLRHLMQFVVGFRKSYKQLYGQLCYKELLIFIVGDFNSNNSKGGNSKLYGYLFDECEIDGIKINDHFIDCAKYCNVNCKFTFHAFDGMEYKNKHKNNNHFIDWIICSKNVIRSDAIKLKRIDVITEHEFGDGLPSDHYPVMLKFDNESTNRLCHAIIDEKLPDDNRRKHKPELSL